MAQIVPITLSEETIAQEGRLSAIQQALRDRLYQDTRLADFQVLYEQQKDITYEIDQAIASMGLVITILTPSATDNSPGIPTFLSFDDGSIVVQVTEDVLINRGDGPDATGIPAGRVAEWVGEDLKCTAMEGSMIIVKGLQQLVNEDDGLVLWNVNCQFSN